MTAVLMILDVVAALWLLRSVMRLVIQLRIARRQARETVEEFDRIVQGWDET